MHVAGEFLARPRAPAPVRGPRDKAMRELRSCYDHLAGRIAVELSSRLLAEDRSGGVRLSSEGESALARLGIDLPALHKGRRVFCRACVDWSERVPHVAGAVGSALLSRVEELGWIRRRPKDRTLILTATGERGLLDMFGITAVRTTA